VLIFVLIKGKVVFAHALKAHETADIEPVILNLGARWRWVVSLSLRPL